MASSHSLPLCYLIFKPYTLNNHQDTYSYSFPILSPNFYLRISSVMRIFASKYYSFLLLWFISYKYIVKIDIFYLLSKKRLLNWNYTENKLFFRTPVSQKVVKKTNVLSFRVILNKYFNQNPKIAGYWCNIFRFVHARRVDCNLAIEIPHPRGHHAKWIFILFN